MREPKEILINGKTLEKILEDHKHWLNRDIDGFKQCKFKRCRFKRCRFK